MPDAVHLVHISLNVAHVMRCFLAMTFRD